MITIPAGAIARARRTAAAAHAECAAAKAAVTAARNALAATDPKTLIGARRAWHIAGWELSKKGSRLSVLKKPFDHDLTRRMIAEDAAVVRSEVTARYSQAVRDWNVARKAVNIARLTVDFLTGRKFNRRLAFGIKEPATKLTVAALSAILDVDRQHVEGTLTAWTMNMDTCAPFVAVSPLAPAS
jgi:hypothetical protein